MLFSLTNASAAFQRFMNNIFSNLLDVYVMIYCWFIFNYLDIVISLISLTQKNIYWNFDFFCCDAFNSFKKVFTSAPILTHWIPDAQLIVETNALDCALTVILSIFNKENEVYLVAFHFHTFTAVELNYDIHDKELLAIFEAFKIWRHYLESLAYSINIVTDYKNLKYFSTTKMLIQRQVQWSKYLSQFNLVIRFHPSYLGTKPDTLTRQQDVYPKEGNTGYTTVNPHNFKLIFTQEQLVVSTQATVLLFPSLYAAIIVDLNTLY